MKSKTGAPYLARSVCYSKNRKKERGFMICDKCNVSMAEPAGHAVYHINEENIVYWLCVKCNKIENKDKTEQIG